jgi:hypothetical protein
MQEGRVRGVNILCITMGEKLNFRREGEKCTVWTDVYACLDWASS